jgi:hypothetical protein
MAKAEVVEALRALSDARQGKLSPEDVVQAARDPDSPLHSQFDWNDDEAAAKWRLEQARTLIRSVRVVFEVADRQVSTVHYIRDPSQPARAAGYVDVASLRREPDDARAAVVAEFRRAASALSRARALAAVLGIDEDVAELIERLDLVRVGVEQAAA